MQMDIRMPWMLRTACIQVSYEQGGTIKEQGGILHRTWGWGRDHLSSSPPPPTIMHHHHHHHSYPFFPFFVAAAVVADVAAAAAKTVENMQNSSKNQWKSSNLWWFRRVVNKVVMPNCMKTIKFSKVFMQISSKKSMKIIKSLVIQEGSK